MARNETAAHYALAQRVDVRKAAGDALRKALANLPAQQQPINKGHK